MSQRPLRPLALGEIIDTAFKVYVRNWRPLVALVAAVVIPAGILQYLVLTGAVPEDLFTRLSDPDLVLDEATVSDSLRLMGAAIAAALIQALASILANAGIMRAVAEIYLGRRPDWRESLRFAAGRLPALIATVVLMVVTIGSLTAGAWLFVGLNLGGPGTGGGGLATLALIAWLVLVVWIGISWTMAIPALVVERTSPAGALARSYALVRGRWWPVFGTLLTIWLIVVVISQIAGRILGAFLTGGAAVDAALTIAVSVATAPFVVSALAVIYFDLRTRKETFSLGRLAAEVGVPPPPETDVGEWPDDDSSWPPLPPEPGSPGPSFGQ